MTLQRQVRWGQVPLFLEEAAETARRYRVFDGATWGPATASLPLAVAQARAVALAGHRAVLWAHDGSGVTLTWGGPGFALVAHGVASWAMQCRSLLERYG